MSRREYLGIYIAKNPRTPAERNTNAEKGRNANFPLSMNNLVSLTKPSKKKWAKIYKHFCRFVNGKCTFADITVDLCDGFRTYLLNAKQLKHEKRTLSQNSAAGYWSTFRGLLNLALKEKYLILDKIETQDTRRQFLTIEEVQALYETPCRFAVLKAASLFSCLTGLRFSDILALRWENFETYPDGGHCIRLRTEKTDEAYELCGEKSTGLVFKGFKKKQCCKIFCRYG